MSGWRVTTALTKQQPTFTLIGAFASTSGFGSAAACSVSDIVAGGGCVEEDEGVDEDERYSENKVVVQVEIADIVGTLANMALVLNLPHLPPLAFSMKKKRQIGAKSLPSAQGRKAEDLAMPVESACEHDESSLSPSKLTRVYRCESSSPTRDRLNDLMPC